MAQQSINGQTHKSTNHVTNVAIVGASGRCGRSIVDDLLDTGKHHVTAITRPDSTNTLPARLHEIRKVDYSDHAALVAALTGQDVLIITLAVMAPPESQIKLVDAAIEAGVKYIMPNQWGSDVENKAVSDDTMMSGRYIPVREHIQKQSGGETSWIAMTCGFWYEFSLAGTEARYGFDFDKKTLVLYDEGNSKINTSTWAQVGRAVASLLSLKISPESDEDKSPCLAQFSNKSVCISSFFVSQRDMFESVLRVTGDSQNDWTVTHENSKERYERGLQMMKAGQMVGFAMLLYVRVFYPDGSGDFNHKLDNDVLGLPTESLDEATRTAVEMARRGETHAVH